ncbi:winged helix-turn-helix domain-containing protein, partial [Aquifex sp.]
YRILKEIKDTGSIKEAANRLGISYKKTLEHIKVMEKRLGKKVVERKRGKGAKITPEGEKLIKEYREAKRLFDNIVKSLYR